MPSDFLKQSSFRHLPVAVVSFETDLPLGELKSSRSDYSNQAFPISVNRAQHPIFPNRFDSRRLVRNPG